MNKDQIRFHVAHIGNDQFVVEVSTSEQEIQVQMTLTDLADFVASLGHQCVTLAEQCRTALEQTQPEHTPTTVVTTSRRLH